MFIPIWLLVVVFIKHWPRCLGNRLAQRIVQGDVPQALMNRRVCALSWLFWIPNIF